MAAAPETQKITLVHASTGVTYQFWGPDATDARRSGEYLTPEAYAAQAAEPVAELKGKAK